MSLAMLSSIVLKKRDPKISRGRYFELKNKGFPILLVKMWHNRMQWSKRAILAISGFLYEFGNAEFIGAPKSKI